MVGTISNAPEIRSPILDKPLDRARARFDEAVALAKHLAEAERCWARLGRLVTIMERDHDFEPLGFKSINACIMEIELLSGYGRSSIYDFRELYQSLEANTGEAVLEMRHGTARIVRELPAALQRDPEVREAAKRLKPAPFREKMAKEHPEALIETKERIELNLEGTSAQVFHEAIEAMRTLYERPNLSYEGALEISIAEWMSAPYEDSGVSNLERYHQLRNLK